MEESPTLAEKLSVAHLITATLTPSQSIIMMSGDNTSFLCGWTGHFGCHFPYSQWYGCDEFGPFAQDWPNKIPPPGTPYHHGRSRSRHQYTHNQRDRSHSYCGPRHRRHDNRSQSCPIHNLTKAAALEGTPHTLFPATGAAHTTFQQVDAPFTPHSMIPIGIVAPHPTLTISPAGTTHATPWTRASLAKAAPTMQHKILSM